MAAFEVIALDTATPQLRAPGVGDTYTFPRAVEMPLGTANGVLYLNGSKVVTSGSGLTFDGANLGLGTIAPKNNTGYSTFTLNNATNGGVVQFCQADTTVGQLFFDGSNAVLRSVTNIPLVFGVNNSEQMRLTSTGLGIGTNNPRSLLDVRGTTAITWGAGTASFGLVTIGTEGSGGSVFVNTPSLNATFNSGLGIDGTYNAGTGKSVIQLRALGVKSGGPYSSDLAFSTTIGVTETERMRLDSSGNLGLGVTPSGNYLLQAGSNASAAARGFNLMTLRGGFSGADYPRIGYNFRTTTTDGSYLFDTSDFASSIRFASGGFQFFTTSASGTAGNPISFTQAMTLHASGGLSVGSTSDPGANTIALTKLSIKVDGPFFTGANIDSGSNQLGIGASSGTAVIGLFTANTERIRIKSQGQLRYVPLAADPAGAENGDVYYNSTTNKLRVYAGGAWVDLH